MKNFFLVLSHYNFIQIKVKTKKSMTLQSFNIRGWKWLSAYNPNIPDTYFDKVREIIN